MYISPMLSSYSQDFCFMEKTIVPDGQGGAVTRWKEGISFNAIQRHDSTIEAQVAESDGTASTYSFLVDKSIPLEPFDIIKRIKDGEVFQVTTKAMEEYTPDTSGLNMTLVRAKKWVLAE